MIRPITTTDHDIFIDLSLEFYHSPAVSHAVETEVHERTFNEVINSSPYLTGYIIESDNVVCGYALCTFCWSAEVGGRVVLLEEIYIRDSFRSKGLGKSFFEYIHNQRLGTDLRFRLEVMPENKRAIKLYENEGFEVIPYTQMVKDFI